jgi:hypothetical protein
MKIMNSLLALLFASILAPAQQPATDPTKPAHHPKGCRVAKRPTPPRPTAAAAPGSSDFFVGGAKVDVAKDDTVVRLAMAQHGSVLIELPANDGPRYIIPGDPEMATVDQKALERNKRAIVVRPGAQFVAPPRNRQARSPVATVTAQMRSGLVVTFLFYPVDDLSQNVHRCVLNYSRDEVVARRRGAGLPVNLDNDQERGQATAQNAAALSSTTSQVAQENKPESTASTGSPSEPLLLDAKIKAKSESAPTPSPPAANVDTPRPGPTRNNTRLAAYSPAVATLCSTALEEATKNPEQFRNWTQAVHGISLSVEQRSDYSEGFNVLILAVKNKTTETLKLLPGSPDLFVETLDDKGQSLNLQQIKTIYDARDGPGAIPSGATVYFALAYVYPVLDVHQQVKIVVAQTNAADEPASISLASSER